jgi:beta-phosphoglucomutase
MKPKAFIFDLDGVLTDTAHCHYTAWKELCDRLGLAFSEEDNQRLRGVSRSRSLEIILELNGCADQFDEKRRVELTDWKNQKYREQIERLTPRDLLPGIPVLLDQAEALGIRLAVASASRNAPRVIRLLGIQDRFDYVADAGRITRGKPDPAIFLDCSAHLGLSPRDCIGWEDAQAGIEAIHRAGMFSAGIGVEAAPLPPHYSLRSFEELSLDALFNAYSLWREA